MTYSECCYRYSENRLFSFCPECENLLIRCKNCGNLCDETGICENCFNILGIIKTGRKIKQNQVDINDLRLQNKGCSKFFIERIEYRPSGTEEYVKKNIKSILNPDKSVDIILNNIVPRFAGRCALDIKLTVHFLDDTFLLTATKTYATVKEDMSGRHIIIKDNKLQGASDIKVDMGESTLSSILEDNNEEKFEKLQFSRKLPDTEKYLITRSTIINYPDPETGEIQKLNFAKSCKIMFGKNRPSKDPEVDAMMRVLPVDSKMKHQANKRISRHHFFLELKSNILYLTDISSCGTIVNGKKIQNNKSVKIKNNTSISPLTQFQYTPLLTYKVKFIKNKKKVKSIIFKKIP